MKNRDFYKILEEECKLIEKKYSHLFDPSKIKQKETKNSYIILFWFLENYGVSSEEIENAITEGKNDNSADLIFKHKNFQGEDEFYVVQSKWIMEGRCELNMESGELNGILTEFEEIRDGELDATHNTNEKFKERYLELRKHVANNGKVNYIILSLMNVELSTKDKKRIDILNEVRRFNEFFLYDNNKLKIDYIEKNYKGYRVRNPLQTPKKPNENIEINILPLSKNKVLDFPSPQKAYLFCITPGEVFKLFDKYQYSIFQDNIRNPLYSSEINEKMIETLKNNPTHFWYFNNGITAITDKIYDLNTENNSPILEIKGIQIINGGQTFKQIYDFYKKLDLSEQQNLNNNVKILFKIIENAGGDFERRVTRFTNSQNETKPRDFYSNDSVQKRIQKEFFRNSNIWYEIRRGEFIHRKPSYIQEIISNEYFGQCYLAYKLGFPEKAKSQTGKIFFNKSDDGFYEDIFNENTTFNDLFISGVIFDFITQKEKEYRKKYNSINKKVKENPEYELSKNEEIIIIDDFLLHSSFHILMCFKKKFDERGGKFGKITAEDFWYNGEIKNLEYIYLGIVKTIRELIFEKEKNPGFTLTKYFKNSESTRDMNKLF